MLKGTENPTIARGRSEYDDPYIIFQSQVVPFAKPQISQEQIIKNISDLLELKSLLSEIISNPEVIEDPVRGILSRTLQMRFDKLTKDALEMILPLTGQKNEHTKPNGRVLYLSFDEREAIKDLLSLLEDTKGTVSDKTILTCLWDLFRQYDEIIEQDIVIDSKLPKWKDDFKKSLTDLVNKGLLPRVVLEHLYRLDNVEIGGMSTPSRGASIRGVTMPDNNQIMISAARIMEPTKSWERARREQAEWNAYKTFVHEALHLLSGVEISTNGIDRLGVRRSSMPETRWLNEAITEWLARSVVNNRDPGLEICEDDSNGSYITHITIFKGIFMRSERNGWPIKVQDFIELFFCNDPDTYKKRWDELVIKINDLCNNGEGDYISRIYESLRDEGLS